MDDTCALLIIDSDLHAIGDVLPPSSLDLAIATWLDAKFKHTQSKRTFNTYRDILTQFRTALQRAGLDLDTLHTQEERDSALLMILLETGHRATVVAGLQWRHVKTRRNVVTLFFERCKGNKSTHVELSKESSAVLLRWLKIFYGQELGKLSGESPLWVSLARNAAFAEAIQREE